MLSLFDLCVNAVTADPAALLALADPVLSGALPIENRSPFAAAEKRRLFARVHAIVRCRAVYEDVLWELKNMTPAILYRMPAGECNGLGVIRRVPEAPHFFEFIRFTEIAQVPVVAPDASNASNAADA